MSYGTGGQPPYGAGGWGGPTPPPPGGGYGPPPPPPPPLGPQQPPASQGSAIGALIANVIGLCLCWVATLPGLILAIIGLSIASSNPSAARTCTLISWILFGVGAVAGVIYIALYGFAIFGSAMSGSY
ncbi:hypothetical protein ACFO4E_14410 [Nocardiopsis mangrovi]|uniref:DUF4190 domain-containing protein n=1 Tax=Nocardiopsis mangrovi TaxID=1179818 RepID=A0ABV9DW02_9ACTN